MCFGGSTNTAGDAALAFQQQQQSNITTGQSQLSNIFNGGSVGTNPIGPNTTGASTPFSGTTQYCDATGNPVTGDAASKLYNNGLLFTGEENSPGFTPAFYAGRAQDYVNYAQPQLTQQYQGQLGQFNANLANRGLTNSSVAQQGLAGLNFANSQAQTGIVNTGIQQSQALQQQVSQEENALNQQLLAGQNPTSTGIAGLSAAGSYQTPSAFAPVGNFLQNWISLYGANNLAQSGQSPSASASLTLSPFSSLGNNFASIN